MKDARLGFTVMPELALSADRRGLNLVTLHPSLRRTLHLLTQPPKALGPMALAFVTAAERSERLIL